MDINELAQRAGFGANLRNTHRVKIERLVAMVIDSERSAQRHAPECYGRRGASSARIDVSCADCEFSLTC